jgi:hypothetical protein
MLKTCDEFAEMYDLKFNADKSKYLTFCPYGKRKIGSEVAVFMVGSNVIEEVDKWTHLGHIINNKLSDDDDIMDRRNSLVGQINNFLCNFSKLDSAVKNELYKVYCSSLYGCELWDLNNVIIEKCCVEWRKGARRVWKLPRDAKSDIVYCIADVTPTFDEICRRSLNFIVKCRNSDSQLVRFIVNCGLEYSCMHFSVARNAIFCSLRYGKSVDKFCDSHKDGRLFRRFYMSQISNEIKALADNARELALVRDTILFVPNISVPRELLNLAISDLVT